MQRHWLNPSACFFRIKLWRCAWEQMARPEQTCFRWSNSEGKFLVSTRSICHEYCTISPDKRGHYLLRQLNIITLDVGALLAAPRLGGASAAPTIDIFNCLRNIHQVFFVICHPTASRKY